MKKTLPSRYGRDNVHEIVEAQSISGEICETEPPKIKFHFEVTEDVYNRFKRYVSGFRIRHEFAKLALMEWLNRKEGRDKKLQAEKLVRDSKYIQEMLDKGLIVIQKKK